MMQRMSIGAILILLSLPAVAAGDGYVLSGVNVVRPELNRVDPEQTVFVQDGVIVAVGDDRDIAGPEGAKAIAADGHYLLPGLTEMHAHVPLDVRRQQYLEDVLFLWVANGITTVRNMAGAPFHLQLREQIADGEVLGPRLFSSGPRFAGKRLKDIDAMVAAQKSAGHDFLKVHMGLQGDAYDQITAAARKYDIDVAGHVDTGVGLERALAASQATIDHLDSCFRELNCRPGLQPSLSAIAMNRLDVLFGAAS